MPKSSVIVPVYKVEPYIHRCVDSILAQTFTDFELILVDDGSPDNCGAICDEYEKKDSRVHVIHQKNGGLSAARNAGIDWVFANSNSEWISFIDSDDWVHPMYLEALYRAVMDHNTGISICGFAQTTGEDPSVDTAALHPVLWDTEDFFVENDVNAIIACGKLYRKADFAEIRYPVGKIHEDEFTTHKLLFRHPQAAVIKQPLYAYYQNPNGIMQSEWTPRRLIGADALAEQVLFFGKHNLNKAQQKSVKRLLGNMQHHIGTMRGFGEQYESECHAYTKRYRRYFRKYRRILPPQERENAQLFLHPKLNLYFVFRRYAREKGIWFAMKKIGEHIRKRTE